MNYLSKEKLNELYREKFGISQDELNREFLGDLKKCARILEVGSNIGTQPGLLKEIGFNKLHGIEMLLYWEAKKCLSTFCVPSQLFYDGDHTTPFRMWLLIGFMRVQKYWDP